MAQLRGAAALRRASSSGKPSTKYETSDVPTSLDQLKKYLYSLTLSNFVKYGDVFGSMARGYLTMKPQELTAVTSLILEAAIDTKENTKLGAMVCKAIIYPDNLPAEQENSAKAFRNTIIESLHKKYEEKKQIRKNSIESWLAIFSFLCDLYNCLHVPSGKALKLIGKVILEACKFMFENPDCDDDEIECMCMHLKNNGKELEEQEASDVERVVSELRTLTISRSSTERVRCVCMDLIEYRANGYSDPCNKLSDYYLVALQDAIANDETQ